MKCKRCLTELKKDEERNCLYCPVCYPPQKAQEPTEEKEKKYVDVRLTESVVRDLIKEIVPDMIRDELENWHIQKPPISKEEVMENILTGPGKLTLPEDPIIDWRAQAKSLGVELFHKKKVDVLKEIEAIVSLNKELKVPERDDNDRSQEQV